MFRSDVKNILLLPADGHLGKIERLGIHPAIHGEFAKLSEFRGIHVRRSQRCFIQILASALVVVVIREDIHTCIRATCPAPIYGTDDGVAATPRERERHENDYD